MIPRGCRPDGPLSTSHLDIPLKKEIIISPENARSIEARYRLLSHGLGGGRNPLRDVGGGLGDVADVVLVHRLNERVGNDGAITGSLGGGLESRLINRESQACITRSQAVPDDHDCKLLDKRRPFLCVKAVIVSP